LLKVRLEKYDALLPVIRAVGPVAEYMPRSDVSVVVPICNPLGVILTRSVGLDEDPVAFDVSAEKMMTPVGSCSIVAAPVLELIPNDVHWLF
jgi:hypothetical protein